VSEVASNYRQDMRRAWRALELARRHPDRAVAPILANARPGGPTPHEPRRRDPIFDGFLSNMVADRFGFEELTVPTLIVSAVDDHAEGGRR
jgi:hypothetical protein